MKRYTLAPLLPATKIVLDNLPRVVTTGRRTWLVVANGKGHNLWLQVTPERIKPSEAPESR